MFKEDNIDVEVNVDKKEISKNLQLCGQNNNYKTIQG